MVDKSKVTKYSGVLGSVNSGFVDREPIAIRCGENLALSLNWLGHFLTFHPGNSANVIAESSYSAAVEATTLISLGALRSAILSLRSHYEFFLMYLFYIDHRVELESSLQYRSHLKLPGDIKKYLKEYYPDFVSRWATLIKVKTRPDDDLYGRLSAVAHGSAVASLPAAKDPGDVLVSPGILTQAEVMFSDVSENLSDFCVATSSVSWISLPQLQRSALLTRLGPAAKKKLNFH